MTFSQRLEPYFSFGLMVLVCTLGFGIAIPNLGFTWDDYASLLVYQRDGQTVFTEWFGGQGRPLGGYLSGLIWEQAGQRAEIWHGINFLLYLASVLLVWRIVRLLWSDQPTLSTLIALLFAVYPSYHLRPITISSNLIASLVIFLLSFWLSLLAIQRKNYFLMVAAGLLLPLYPLIYEQPAPYELLRLVAIGYLLYQQGERFWGKWVQWVLPIGAGGLLFLVYRLVIYQPNETYASYNAPIYLESLDGWLLTFKRSITAPVQLLFLDWIRQPWEIFGKEGADIDLAGLAGVAVLGLVLIYVSRYPLEKRPRHSLPILVFSLIMLPILLLAVHLVGQALTVGFNSRWALIPSPLLAVVVGMGATRFLKNHHAQALLAVLIALGLAVQIGVNQLYQQDWQLRRDLWWQMTWRAPQLEAGTLITVVFDTDELAFDRRVTDYELTTLSNLYYTGETYPHVVAADANALTVLIRDSLALAGNWSEVMSKSRIIFRDWDYDLKQVVVFGYGGGCLRTADPQTHAQSLTTADFVNLAPYHQPAQILPTPPNPGADNPAISPEPLHSWCYAYQTIQATLQQGEIARAVEQADQARQAGYRPLEGDEVEWLPLIEAYNRAGNYAEAEKLLAAIGVSDTAAQTYACERLTYMELPSEIQIRQQALLPQCQG